MKDTILYGDCRESLKNITTKCQMCVTSPPYYGLRDYGGEASQIGQESTPEEYIQEMVKTFRLVRDCLTDDGTLWLNIGDSYYNYRPGKGSRTYPQQTIASNNQDLPEYTNKRGNKLEGYKEKDLIGIPWMLAFALRADGWYLRQDIIWHKPNPMPESVKDRCTKSHEYLFLLSKNKNYYYDHESIKEKAVGERWGGNNPINMDNTKDTNNTFSGLTRPRKMVYDKRNKLSREVEKEARDYFSEKVYLTVIPRNVRLSEAPSHGMPVLIYDKTCPGSKSYFSFTDEFMNQESTIGSAA